MDPRVREGDKCGGGLTGTRDSDEGPFSRREEGWELGEEKEKEKEKRKKTKGEHQRIDIRRSMGQKLQKSENYKLVQFKRVSEGFGARDRFPDRCQ